MNSKKLLFHFSKGNLMICLMLVSLCGFSQPFAIGHTTVTFVDASRDNREIETEIYYPADVAGNDVALTAINADKFPVLAFGHGFLITYTAYQYLWEELVPKGYIMAFPTTEGGLLPSHSNYGSDLAFVVSSMSALGLSDTSLFFGRVSDMNAVMGHSMGGGAAFLAANGNSAIRSLLTLSPAETNPSAIAAAGGLTIPALIFAGSNDCVTPPDANQVPMYQGLQSECKTYINITGGSHCQMADSNFFCGIGEATCSPAPAITRGQQHEVILNYVDNWLQSQLKGDCESGSTFNSEISSDTAITFEKTCLQCEPLSVAGISDDLAFSVYPNPVKDQFYIVTKDNSVKKISIYDIYSRKIIQKTFTESAALNAEKWSSGIYFYTVSNGNGIISKGKFLKQ